MDVYDIAGRRVRTWLDEPAAAAGMHTIHVGPGAPAGSPRAGLYFYRIRAAEGVVTRRFLVVREGEAWGVKLDLAKTVDRAVFVMRFQRLLEESKP